MPKHVINEAEIKKIASKYVYSVTRDPGKIPNIKELISEAFKNIAPERKVEHEDIASVVSQLSKRSSVNDKAIHEAAKKVLDHSATEDMKFMINRNAKALGKRITADDVNAIIKQGKLNPHSSSLQSIKDAVKNFYTKGKPLEAHTPTEIHNVVKAELMRKGPVDERDVQAVTAQYMKAADQERPLNVDHIRDIIRQYVPGVPNNEGPQPSQISRGGKPQSTVPPKKPDDKIKQGEWVPPKDPKNLTFFDKIRLKMRRYGLKSLTRGARNWLTDSVNKVSKTPSRQKFLTEGQTVAEALIGNMFMYFYDAKTKADLPYWDKFPLIFVIELYDDGWLGLNLHYLPLILRTKLFDKLLEYANDKSLDKITKLRLSYGLLKSVSQFPEVRPTIKRYLSSQVRSQLLRIEPVDWEIAVFLPVEQFQKEKKEKVWTDSRRMIQNLKRRR